MDYLQQLQATMKKIYLLLCLILPGLMMANNEEKGKTEISLMSATAKSTVIKFSPAGFSFKTVNTPKGDAQTLVMDEGTFLLQDGAPDLLKLSKSLIIPDQGTMDVAIVSADYYDLQNIEMAPSKGNLKRNINPADVPYTYGSAYQQNQFFPAALAELRSPYILRDFRAQTIVVYPFQYNPQTKVLRVYTSIVVKVDVKEANGGENEFVRNPMAENILDAEFAAIYKRQFINYGAPVAASKVQYTQVAENGSMLVICYDSFAADIQPFVDWKNKKGISTQLVLKSVAGTTAAAIKTYISTYYTTHPNLKYILLVGDAPQVPASSTSNGDSDNNYGYLSGSDSYPEVFVGRFSATTSAQVQTMVNRCLSYEKSPQLTGTWYKNGITIGSDQGPGDNNEYDWQHQRVIRGKLLAYNYNGAATYTAVTENYDGSQGGVDAAGSPTPAQIATQVNNGAGIITYTGHGGDMEFVTSGFSVTNVNALTNTDKWPFIWSVACVNGNFVANATCFAEAWLRAGTPTAPKGAIATLMSTINQSWNPPMRGQDAMINILVESVQGNVKRTFGGLSMNGCMDMNDAYPGNEGPEMTDTWTTFGDPSVMVFTNTPTAMTVSHITTTSVGVTTVNVNCNTEGALICLSLNGVILGTGTVVNGVAVITFNAVNNPGTIDVVATAYNHAPYAGTIVVTGANGIAANTSSHQFSVYPVPVQNTLTIAVQFNQSEKVKLSIYNSLGQEVISVFNKDMAQGTYTETVDVSKLAAGVYVCKLQTGNQNISKRIIVTD